MRTPTRRFTEARDAFTRAAFDEELARNEPAHWERSVKGARSTRRERLGLADLRCLQTHIERGAAEG